MGRQYDLSVLFRVIDKATKPLRDVGRNLNRLGGPVDRLRQRFNKLAMSAQEAGQKMKDVGRDLSLKLTAPLVLAAGLATRTSIKFESAFTGVRKTVTATEKQFAHLKKGLMDMALVVPTATEEIFGIAEAAGQLNVKQDEILEFTKVMVDLGETTNIVAKDAAMSLARFSKITGLSKKDVSHLAATIVDLGNSSETTEAEILELAMRLVGAGTQIGLTEAQIISLATSLSSVGIQAEMGGSAFSRVMRQIDKEIGSGSQKMKDFAMVSGKSVSSFEKDWKENAGLAILDVVEGLGTLQKEGANVNVILEDLGFSGLRVSDALSRASGAGDAFRKTMKRGNEAWKANNAHLTEANLRYSTTESQLKMARNRVAQLSASFGDVLAPVLLAVVKFLEPVVTWLTNLGPKTKIAIVVIGFLVAAIGPLLVMLGMLVASIGVIAGVTAPVWGVVVAITGAIIALATSARILIKHWEPVKAFFVDLWGSLEEGFNKVTGWLPDWFKKGVGFMWRGMAPGTFAGGGTKEAIAGIGAAKSETDINIRLIADEGTSASVEKVKRKKGDAAVRIASVGYVGAQ